MLFRLREWKELTNLLIDNKCITEALITISSNHFFDFDVKRILDQTEILGDPCYSEIVTRFIREFSI